MTNVTFLYCSFTFSLLFINQYYKGTQLSPLRSLIPSVPLTVTFIISFIIMKFSEVSLSNIRKWSTKTAVYKYYIYYKSFKFRFNYNSKKKYNYQGCRFVDFHIYKSNLYFAYYGFHVVLCTSSLKTLIWIMDFRPCL